MSWESHLSKPWQRKITRRTMLRGTGLALGAAVVGGGLTGCGGGASPTAQPQAMTTSTVSSEKRKPGGTWCYNYGSQMPNLHPQTGFSENIRYVHGRLLVFDYVKGEVHMELAESVENPDPLTYIIKIKPTAKFQQIAPVNGRAVTSTDVAVSWTNYRDNPRTFNKSILTDFVDHYETPDQSTLVIKMKIPTAYALDAEGFANATTCTVVPTELFDQNLLEKTAIGCGGYVLEQFDPTSIASFKRRPDGWFTPELPYIDRTVWYVITDTAAAMAAFKAKQIDFIYPRDKLAAEEISGYDPAITGGLWYNSYPWMLYMRADKPEGMFWDVRVREAVYNALNIDELIEKVDLGNGERTGPIPVNLEPYRLPADEVKAIFPYNPAKAKELLSAAGWDSNLEVPFKYVNGPLYEVFATQLQKQLAAVGIKIKLIPQDLYTVWVPETMGKKDFQMCGGPYIANYITPDSWIRMRSSNGLGTGNFCRWSDPEMDDIAKKQQVEFDTEKRKVLIMEAQRLMIKKFVPNVNLWTQKINARWWPYYHPVLATMGYWGYYSHYDWIDVDNPHYPKEERLKKFGPV